MKRLILPLILGILFIALISQANASVVYPLYSSVCCKLGTSDYTPLTQDTISQTEKTYTCPINTACQVINPVVSCSSLGDGGFGNLWLGYTTLWQVKANGGTYSSTSQSDKNTLALGVAFSEGQSITYSGSCAGNGKWITRVLTSGISMFFEGAVAPPSSSLNIKAKVGHLIRYPALEGQYDIDGTQYCQRNNEVNSYMNNLPTSDSIGTQAEKIGTGSSSTPSLTGNPTQTLLDSTRFYIDTCKRGVDKYIELPEYGNMNPKGQYQNKDVICSKEKGIISLTTLTSTGGSSYKVPNQILNANPDCCSDQDCSWKGVGYACKQNTYTCEKVAGYCNNDLDCDPNHGENEGMNCFKSGSSFYTTSSRCVDNRCSPYPATTTPVKCCAGYCALTNQVCDPLVKGCYTPTTPQPQCPSGYCCDGETNQFQGCDNGKTCCYDSNDAHRGTCKTTCASPVECKSDSDCKDSTKPICNNNKCVADNLPGGGCAWYQENSTSTSKDYGFLYYRFFLNNPVVSTTSTCVTAGWFYIAEIGAFIVFIMIIILVIILALRGKKRR